MTTVMRGKKKERRPPSEDWRLYWFACLERALETGDAEGEALARANLERLGVEIVYRTQPTGATP